VRTQHVGRLDWVLAIATVAAIVGTVAGRRIGQAVEDISFIALLILVILFVAMAWWRFGRAWKNEGTARWKVWVSLAGCVALSLAFGLPLIPFIGSLTFGMGFGPGWDYKFLMFGFGVGALVLGMPSARGVRFPLIAGGMLIALVGLILPVGV